MAKTSYPKKGAKRTGTSYDGGKTYDGKRTMPAPSFLGAGLAAAAAQALEKNDEAEKHLRKVRATGGVKGTKHRSE